MKEIITKIAGEITLSDSPGETMKKWRELFGVTQKELAKKLGITSSTISDYETGRRKNPGIGFIKRFVEALISIDLERGGPIIEKLREKSADYYQVIDFPRSMSLKEFVEKIEGKVISNEDLVDKIKIYGYTIVDSIRAILEMNVEDFPKLYSTTSERAFLFLGVSTGRSPLVVIKVAPIKPKAVVLHNIKKVDPLAVKISIRERIPIIVTELPVSEIKKRLSEF